jgi:hypothetical protein
MQLLGSGNLHVVDHYTENSLRFQDMRERGPKFGQGCPDRMFGRHASLLSMQAHKGKKPSCWSMGLFAAAYYCKDAIRSFALSSLDGLTHR